MVLVKRENIIHVLGVGIPKRGILYGNVAIQFKIVVAGIVNVVICIVASVSVEEVGAQNAHRMG